MGLGGPSGKVVFQLVFLERGCLCGGPGHAAAGCSRKHREGNRVWVLLYSMLLMGTFSASIFCARAIVCAQEPGRLLPCPCSSRKQVNRSPALELAQQGWLWRREELGPGQGCWGWSCVQRVLQGSRAAFGCRSTAQHKELEGGGVEGRGWSPLCRTGWGYSAPAGETMDPRSWQCLLLAEGSPAFLPP